MQELVHGLAEPLVAGASSHHNQLKQQGQLQGEGQQQRQAACCGGGSGAAGAVADGQDGKSLITAFNRFNNLDTLLLNPGPLRGSEELPENIRLLYTQVR